VNLDYAASNAVLIGVGDYDDELFPPVPAALNSLREMHAVLTDAGLCGWPTEKVAIFRDPRGAGQTAALIREIAMSTRETFLLYFVGHGKLSAQGELCLAMVDTTLENADFTGLRYGWIREILLDSPASVKISILDCCAAGRAIQTLSGSADDLAQYVETEGVYTLAATEGSGPAHVSAGEDRDKVATSFTREFVSLLSSGIENGPEWITLSTIFPHLRDRLAKRGLPRPSQISSGTVMLRPFSRNPASPAVLQAETADFVQQISLISERFFADDYDWELPAWSSWMREQDYLYNVSDQYSGFVNLSRQLIRTELSTGIAFEPCDLLGPGDELIFVRRSSGSSARLLSYFLQALVSCEMLRHLPEARAALSDAVARADPSREIEIDFNATKVIFAVAPQNISFSQRQIIPEMARVGLALLMENFESRGIAVNLMQIPIVD
jgi:hypothetical protein